jgi:aryl-alcohol dehydrogenase-like predicted oxidoreductase
MQRRPLGETGQASSIAAFGAIALNALEPEAANRLVELVLDSGVNHIDVAPTYGDAERKLGPKLREHREDVFLGCKTLERDYEGAKRELDQSLTRLGVDTIDLYQVHALGSREDLEAITAEDGALRAFREAKAAGKIDHIGVTGHDDPALLVEAIDRIDDLDSIMFPLNPVVAGKQDGKYDYESVLARADDAGVGTLGIKAFAAGPWPDTDELPERRRPYATWYDPVDDPAAIAERFDFAAAQGLTSVLTPGDPTLVAMVLAAAGEYDGLTEAAQERLVDRLRDDESPVPRKG